MVTRTTHSDANDPASNAGGVAAVDRALSILLAFRRSDRGLTLAELAKRTGYYKSTILRLLDSLIRSQFIQKLDDGRYQIGPAAFIVGGIYQSAIRVDDIVPPLMRALLATAGESVSFHTRIGAVRLVLFRIDSHHAIRDHIREGDVLPMHLGSGGRVLGAFSGATGKPYDDIRRKYFHAAFGERDPETAGFSAPVFGTGERLLGALTVSGPRSRIDEKFVERMRKPTMIAAIRATSALGGDAAPIERALATIRTRA